MLDQKIERIGYEVLKKKGNVLFPDLVQHGMDTSFQNRFYDENDSIGDHRIDLMKRIITRYCQIRMKHAAKSKNDELIEKKVRHKLSKLIIFSGQ